MGARFREAGLADAGGGVQAAAEVRERIILGATPPNRGRWSVRSMAADGRAKDEMEQG